MTLGLELIGIIVSSTHFRLSAIGLVLPLESVQYLNAGHHESQSLSPHTYQLSKLKRKAPRFAPEDEQNTTF